MHSSFTLQPFSTQYFKHLSFPVSDANLVDKQANLNKSLFCCSINSGVLSSSGNIYWSLISDQSKPLLCKYFSPCKKPFSITPSVLFKINSESSMLNPLLIRKSLSSGP